ncbi:hypothetical protein [Williamsia sterculiae]|uniref:Uncharacterized protein n=1 Tax=Williamsia sterculiae TaxID=1344003 RepID=A0A1N7GHS7_9NOCA|nr:hypothetical protein [Williamsia sterculiae]SIS12100.1 hypothetical protein SAMN05445060_2803 [Williamsia sterculiae]
MSSTPRSPLDRIHVDLTIPQSPDEDRAGEQLVIGDERAFLELQEAAYVRDIGARALIAAQRLMDLAYEAREVLQDWEEVPTRRRKRLNVLSAVPDLVEVSPQ